MAAKDLYEKDYYQILGVAKGADSAAIKKQYRKLARELHPDKTKGDKKLEDKFKAVSEAYDILGDEKKEISATCLDQAEIFSQPYLVVQGNVMAQICKRRLQLDLKIPFMALN